MPVRSRKKPRTKRPRRSRKTRQNRVKRVKSPKSRRRKSRRKSHRQSRRRISKRIPKLCGGGADMDTDEFGEALYSSDDDRVDMDSIIKFIEEKERMSEPMPVSSGTPLQASVRSSADEIKKSLEKLQLGDEVQPVISSSEHKKLIFMQFARYYKGLTTITPDSVNTYSPDKQNLAHEIAFAYSDVHKEHVTPDKYLEKIQKLVPQIASLTSNE